MSHLPSRRDLIVRASLITACSLALPMPATEAKDALLAIKGYDPVAYFTVGKPLRGSPGIAHDWDEHRYLFSSAEHRELFMAEPVRYAPHFADLCAMALAVGKAKEANPEFWLIADGRLFLFASASAIERFGQSVAENYDRAEHHHALMRKH
jgi:hypothetical protein